MRKADEQAEQVDATEDSNPGAFANSLTQFLMMGAGALLIGAAGFLFHKQRNTLRRD